jgi:hypothetical protein
MNINKNFQNVLKAVITKGEKFGMNLDKWIDYKFQVLLLSIVWRWVSFVIIKGFHLDTLFLNFWF